MRIQGVLEAAALWPSLFAASFSLLDFVGATDEPEIKETQFSSLPILLEYFPDSDVVIYQTEDHTLYRSTNAGSTFTKIEDLPTGLNVFFVRHPFDDKRAYILTDSMHHYRSEDRGETWTEFFVDAFPSNRQAVSQILRFNAANPEYIIFNGIECDGICVELAMYTTDGFRTDAQFLRPNTRGCWWAKSTESFTVATEDADYSLSRSLCIIGDDFSFYREEQRLVISDNFFSADDESGIVQQWEPNLDTDRPVAGVVNMVFVHGYLLVATVSFNTIEMGLYISDDTETWHRAMFHGGHRIAQEEYTVLEGTEYSIQLDVMNTRPSHPMGVLFTSNSNGTFFTRNLEHTNRNRKGRVDFENISGIQGIFLVNTVDNWEEVENYMGDGDDGTSKDPKNKITHITFDDGRTFHEIQANGERLHLHSMTELDNSGRVFSSPAPGLVMGVGNTGKYLESFHSPNTALFLSDDAGESWIKALDGPHKYEFGDQGSVLVAIHDSPQANISEVRYSLNHGKDWKSVNLPHAIKPWILTTTQDSTSLKFVIVGEDKTQYYVHTIDFDGLHERKCKDNDMEDWWARVDDNGKPTCIMGQKQKYRRRKKDADCFIMEKFKDPVPEMELCDCTDADFECDYNFVYDDNKNDCVQAGPIEAKGNDCQNGATTFMGSSGWRKIPGNKCNSRKVEKDALVERQCSDTMTPPQTPGSGEVTNGDQFILPGKFDGFFSWYLERGDSSTQDDETIIMRPIGHDGNEIFLGNIYITHDHGRTWEKPDAINGDNKIWDVVPHNHFKDMAFFIPDNEGDVIYTTDRGYTFHKFKPPSAQGNLMFHPDKMNWIIWVGKQCENNNSCRKIASLSTDRGDHWETIAREVYKCEFTGSSAYTFQNRDERQIYCQARQDEDTKKPWEIQRSNDFFQNKLEPIRNVSAFATMAEFIAIATKEGENLKAKASLDGVVVADAHFPYNFNVPHQVAFTILDSSTHAINLFVATNQKPDHTFGAILKSNSNGTSYVMSAPMVNANDFDYVDFEKILGLEGVILINTVANPDEKDEPKKLQTKISHNDGAEWSFLPPPQTDVDGKSFGCSSRGSADCALHLHGYTERSDYRKTFSAKTAVGLMLGVGNVGKYLGDKSDADTFMTTDGGLSWKSVVKGEWLWQFGDQGSIIVLVQPQKATKIVKYSTDEGETWIDHKFSDKEVTILDLSAQRTGSSRNFIVWGIMDGKATTTTIDFSGLADRECKVIDNNPDLSDYYLWSPKHPLSKNDCLFGRQSLYYRKKTDRNCFNSARLEHKYNERNCSCTRQDFEWQVPTVFHSPFILLLP